MSRRPDAWPCLLLLLIACATVGLALSRLSRLKPHLAESDEDADYLRAQTSVRERLTSEALERGPDGIAYLLAQAKPASHFTNELEFGDDCALPRRRDLVRLTALQLLFSADVDLEPHSEEVVPVVITLLQDSDDAIRQAALVLLFRLKDGCAKAAPALVRLLREYNTGLAAGPTELYRGAVYILGKIGPAGREAAPHLRRVVENPNSMIWSEAVVALWSIERDRTEIRRVLISALQSGEEEIPWVATAILDRIGQDLGVRGSAHNVWQTANFGRDEVGPIPDKATPEEYLRRLLEWEPTLVSSNADKGTE